MHRNLSIGILLALVLLNPAAALADGDIYVGGPYGTKITSLPYTISAPGAYYLGGDLSYSGNGEGIAVNADNVTLDLMGFTLTNTGTGTETRRVGISMYSRKNVEIRNGTVRGWLRGINDDGTGLAHRVINVRLEDNLTGVYLSGKGHLIQGCTASSSGSDLNGFVIEFGCGIISGCLVKNLYYGIFVTNENSVISGNVVLGNGAVGSVGIYSFGGLVMGNEVSNCGNLGIWSSGTGSIIGNTVNTASSSQTGVIIQYPSTPTLLDQNTVTGPGTHYTNTSGAQWRNNGG
jgi:hypothetical protein